MCLDYYGIKLVELICISLVCYWVKLNESGDQRRCGVYTKLTSAECFPQDWDSSAVKAVRLKRREKRVCSIFSLQAGPIVSINWHHLSSHSHL